MNLGFSIYHLGSGNAPSATAVFQMADGRFMAEDLRDPLFLWETGATAEEARRNLGMRLERLAAEATA